MKTFFVLVALVALASCNEGTPGGPGTTNEPPIFGQADDTFNLVTPMSSTALRQGGEVEATIGIEREGHFKKDVTINFSDLPQGITIEPSSTMIKHGDKHAKILIKAAKDAPLGDFNVKVSGHPPQGTDAQNVIKLAIEQ